MSRVPRALPADARYPAAAGAAAATRPAPAPRPAAGYRPTWTDPLDGAARLFASLYGDSFRHVPGLGWYRWSGHRWQPDAEGSALWAAGEMADALTAPAFEHRGAPLLHGLSENVLSTDGITGLLDRARHLPGLAAPASRLDSDPYALCTPAGVVDLRTGTLTAPEPHGHLHSRSTSVGPADTPTPRWDRFLADTFGEDAAGRETTGFLHLLLGRSLTGRAEQQVMPFLVGSGKNGKSVLTDVLMKLLGDYADAAPAGFLMARPFDEHPTTLAELHGRRIIVCTEPDPEDRFDEARVELLTGNGPVTAHRMRREPFTFAPTHTLWLLGNHLPRVANGGDAFWRRMRLIPFPNVVPDERKIDNLAGELVAEEGPGILNWLIEGARRYLGGDQDLTGPAGVRTATTAYAETEDHTARFLDQHLAAADDPAARTRLYRAYQDWCGTEDAAPVPRRTFAARVDQTLSTVRGTGPRTTDPRGGTR
ncbi:DNA primase family protein [Kitasatospora sp. NPDC004272]